MTADALLDQGHAARQRGAAGRAVACYLAAAAVEPDFYAPYANAVALLGSNPTAAARLLDHARRLAPTEPMLALQAGDARTALGLAPAFADALAAVADRAFAGRDWAAGLAWARRAVSAAPDHPALRYNLGTCCLNRGRAGEAAVHLAAALCFDPADAPSLGDYANALVARAAGRPARIWHARAGAVWPSHPAPASNRVFAAMSDPELTETQVRAIAETWPAPAAGPRPTARPRRPLRVGYVSPDFRDHACAAFLTPLFDHHDRRAVTVFAYAGGAADARTAFFRDRSDGWCATDAFDDAALAARIRQDGIDVLVDLAGHCGGNRLGAFARRAAPVQVGWLGFNATTGLRAIDWRLGDRWLMPQGAEAGFTERLWRLDRPAHCWRPPNDAPEITAPDGPPAFGSFNNFSKLSAATIDLWSAVLRAAPDARLILKAPAGGDAASTRPIRDRFAQAGGDPARLSFLPWAAGGGAHLACYGAIDVALDPTPYNGVTTSCEALWMGVPVISLTSARLIGRVGLSLLEPLGRAGWTADTPENYVAAAVATLRRSVADRARRQDLRTVFAAAPWRDEAGFTRAVEAAFSAMAEGRPPPPADGP